MTRRPLVVMGALLLCSGALVAVDGCTIINGLTVPGPEGGVGTLDAGDAADANPDPCPHAYPPPRPPVDPDRPLGEEDFVSVTKEISFGIDADGGFEALSFDLDGVCTCEFGQTDSCRANLTPPKPKCDALGGGQDNAAQPLLNDARRLGNFDFEAAANGSVAKGSRAILIYVQGYNGLDDDDEIKLGVLVSPGLVDGTGEKVTPTFTRADAWQVSDKAALDRDAGLIPLVLRNGYVVGRTLVAAPIDIGLPVTDVALLSLTNVVFVGTIVDVAGGGHSLEEIKFAGRWSMAEATRVLGTFRPNASSGRFCEGMDPVTVATYDLMKTYICEAADLRAKPEDDSKDMACDAMSVAVRGRAAPASLGKLVPAETPAFCTDTVNDCVTK